VGFDAANVTDEAITGLRLFYTLLPIVGVLAAMAVMWTYSITEESAAETRAALARRAAEAR